MFGRKLPFDFIPDNHRDPFIWTRDRQTEGRGRTGAFKPSSGAPFITNARPVADDVCFTPSVRLTSHRSIVMRKGGWKTLHIREDVTLHLEQRNGALASGRPRSWALESIEMIRVWDGEHWMTCESSQRREMEIHAGGYGKAMAPQWYQQCGSMPTVIARKKARCSRVRRRALKWREKEEERRRKELGMSFLARVQNAVSEGLQLFSTLREIDCGGDLCIPPLQILSYTLLWATSIEPYALGNIPGLPLRRVYDFVLCTVQLSVLLVLVHCYVGFPPNLNWPNGAKIAVNFVINYEEGVWKETLPKITRELKDGSRWVKESLRREGDTYPSLLSSVPHPARVPDNNERVNLCWSAAQLEGVSWKETDPSAPVLDGKPCKIVPTSRDMEPENTGFGVEEEEGLDTWASDAESVEAKCSVGTARRCTPIYGVCRGGLQGAWDCDSERTFGRHPQMCRRALRLFPPGIISHSFLLWPPTSYVAQASTRILTTRRKYLLLTEMAKALKI
ncbi:hypothetical protein CPC08DRAFT_728887 [Agrocybe pediades]|nr:hypothetical protein CPC08DRAFT_728887 [Agrocybe pediades]